jgi:hypothetical protein
MLSGLLKSDTAMDVNIGIMRAFVALRQFVIGYAELKQQLDNFMIATDTQFNEVYQALTELAERKLLEDKLPKRKIGFTN